MPWLHLVSERASTALVCQSVFGQLLLHVLLFPTLMSLDFAWASHTVISGGIVDSRTPSSSQLSWLASL